MKTIHIDQTEVFLNVSGSGEPILFLHGVPDTSDIRIKTLEILSPDYLCLAPDLPGFGRTKAPRDFDYSLGNLADFIDKIVVAQKVDVPINLVLHDIGGIVGLALAKRFGTSNIDTIKDCGQWPMQNHPERVAKGIKALIKKSMSKSSL